MTATAKAAAPSTNEEALGGGSELPDLVAMLEAGVHFGHERSKRNPKMEHYIFLQRDRVAIIDLERTQEALGRAAAFVQRLMKSSDREILYVGTKRQAREIVRRQAESVGMPYVTKRWLGGTLTNFATIQKSVEKLDELKSRRDSDTAAKLTKKERAVMQKEIERLEEVLEGIMNVRRLPAALLVAGSHDEKLAVREANRVGIPVIGITDTNADPDLVDYAIPGNDDAVRSLDLLVGTITRAIATARGITLAKPSAVSVTAPEPATPDTSTATAT